jgi:hypothetical protein
MNACKLLVAAVLTACATPGLVFASCSHSTEITNESSVTMRIVELKASYATPFWESQWRGFRAIAPGTTGTIYWTSDLDCTDDSGVANHWDVKLYRSIGVVHYCNNLSAGESVSIDAPDSCSH